VKTAVKLPSIPAGAIGIAKEVGRLFVLVEFADGRRGYYARRQLIPVMSSPEDRSDDVLTPLGLVNAQIPRGSHSCLLPSDEHIAMRSAARYVAAGMKTGDTTALSLPRGWRQELECRLKRFGVDMNQALSSKTLLIVSPEDIYLPETSFTASQQLEKTAKILAAIVNQTPKPLRSFGFVGRRHTYPGWWEYEERLTPILKHLGALCVCCYDHSDWNTAAWRRAENAHSYVIRDGRITAGSLPGEI